MTTTKEFKTLHGLSDSAFNRLTNKIKAEYPDQELTRRINSRDWKIIDVALFEQYLGYQKREASEPSAIVPASPSLPVVRGSVLDSYQLPELEILPTFRHVTTDDFVAGEMAKLDSFLEESASQDEALDQELIQQAIARGSKRGLMLAQIEVAAANKVRSQVVQSAAKKQGLVE
jgi:hypothetical protein